MSLVLQFQDEKYQHLADIFTLRLSQRLLGEFQLCKNQYVLEIIGKNIYFDSICK